MSTYTTKQGDMWDSVAYSQLGSSSYTDQLMLANLQYVDYYAFPAGLILELPVISSATASALPPWKEAIT